MEGKITIKDIAKLTGFSKSTISRYLNNGYVSAEKAERIQSVIAKTGFQSNFFASRLKTKHSKLVGIILPRMDSVSVGKFLSGVTHVLEPDDYQGLFGATASPAAPKTRTVTSRTNPLFLFPL